MGQMGFFDVDKRLRDISAKGDPLEILSHTVPWESFRADLEGALRKAPEGRKSKAGRKPWDSVLIFKALVLQTLYNLADERSRFRSATACPSCASWGSAWRTPCLTARRCGSIAGRVQYLSHIRCWPSGARPWLRQ